MRSHIPGRSQSSINAKLDELQLSLPEHRARRVASANLNEDLRRYLDGTAEVKAIFKKYPRFKKTAIRERVRCMRNKRSNASGKSLLKAGKGA